MELDIRQLAEKLMRELLVESDRLRSQAEGVRLYVQLLIKESEAGGGQQHSDSDRATAEEEQPK